MRLAIFHPWLKQRGGAEKLILKYVENVSRDVTVFTLFYDKESTFEGFQDVDIEVIGERSPPGGMADRFLRFMLGNMILKLPLEKYDALLLSETGMANPLSIRNSGIPVFAYVHTPMRAALPEFKEDYRSEMSLPMKPVFEAGVMVNNIVERISWTRIDHALANSSVTKERMVSKGLAREKDIKVINPGADLVDEEGEYDEYFLYPSRFRRYKRQELAIEAFEIAELPENFRLVLAGSGQEKEYIEELEEKAGENVEIKNDVPKKEWNKLYRNCRATLFLPKAEDWGIVPVESAMHRKPVVCVEDAGSADVVEDGNTGFLVQPDPEQISSALEKLSSEDLAVKVGQKAFERCREMSWENFAGELDREIEEEIDG